jgi:trehalose 6-phosphate phosphatase
VHPGSGVLELRLPGFDKAGALARLAEGRDTVLYLGDDLGDLPAFAEIRRMRSAGRVAYSIGVLSSAADGIADACDLALAGPAEAVDLLAHLAT